jgi:hypothetical protein
MSTTMKLSDHQDTDALHDRQQMAHFNWMEDVEYGDATPDSGPPDDDPKPVRPDRAGKRKIAAYVSSEVYRSFKMLAAEFGLNTDQAVSEALALLFKKYGKTPPADLCQKLQKLGLGS